MAESSPIVRSTNAAPIAAAVFPPGVILVEATPAMFQTPTWPEEELAISHSVVKRLREFRAGRHAAHAAIAVLGAPCTPIPVGNAREPLWPTGVVGTIVHTAGYAAAAVAWRKEFSGLGLDAEPVGAVNGALAGQVCTVSEREVWSNSFPDWLTSLFVAKEAVYKALYPQHRTFLDFHDVEVASFSDRSGGGAFTVRLVSGELKGAMVSGRLARAGGYVFAGVAQPALPGAR